MVGVVVLGAAAAAAAWVGLLLARAPSLAELKPVRQGSSSVIYAADGSRLGFIQSDVLRTPVAAGQIPPLMRLPTVAIEDRRFYEHGGVDFQGSFAPASPTLYGAAGCRVVPRWRCSWSRTSTTRDGRAR